MGGPAVPLKDDRWHAPDMKINGPVSRVDRIQNFLYHAFVTLI